MTSESILLSHKRIFEEVCYNLAQSNVWGESDGVCHLPEQQVKNEREGFRVRVYGLVSLLSGTSLNPIGTPLKAFMGAYIPEDWIDIIKDGDYWPKWYAKRSEQSELR